MAAGAQLLSCLRIARRWDMVGKLLRPQKGKEELVCVSSCFALDNIAVFWCRSRDGWEGASVFVKKNLA